MSADGSPTSARSPSAVDERQFVLPAKQTILVRDQQQGETKFVLRPTTKFKKVKDAWCEKQGVDVLAVRFSFDGRRINDHETLEDVSRSPHVIMFRIFTFLGSGLTDLTYMVIARDRER